MPVILGSIQLLILSVAVPLVFVPGPVVCRAVCPVEESLTRSTVLIVVLSLVKLVHKHVLVEESSSRPFEVSKTLLSRLSLVFSKGVLDAF